MSGVGGGDGVCVSGVGGSDGVYVSGVGGGDGVCVCVRVCVHVIEPCFLSSLLPPDQSECTIQSIHVRRGLR